MARRHGLRIEASVTITTTPARVISAFFDAAALASWWQAARSVTTPRPLGIYAVEWRSTPFEDDVLGALGGVFYGTVMQFRNAREFFLAEAYWLPPESDPIGPMALEVTCRVDGPATTVRIRQSSADDGARWRRYEKLMAAGWNDSLAALKEYLEQGAQPRLPPRGVAPHGVADEPPFRLR